MKLASTLMPLKVASKTVAGTISPQEVTVLADTTAAEVTLTLPAASDAFIGIMYTVRFMAGGNNLTVAFPGGAFNPSDVVLSMAGETVNAYSDGINWYNVVVG